MTSPNFHYKALYDPFTLAILRRVGRLAGCCPEDIRELAVLGVGLLISLAYNKQNNLKTY